ncbi:MAG TPA: hypothetical protein VK766_09425 [Cytophagaceae bacterium]|jgi:hypothetical protein|nr:hypothetical protein [Cytophagaceae bacterium]
MHLEAGYLAEIYKESLYTMGYDIVGMDSSMNTMPPVAKTLTSVATNTLPKEKSLSVAVPNAQKIDRKCILLFLSKEDELSTVEATFLAKVMQAASVHVGEYECINFRGITINDIASRYTFDKLILFGVKIPNLEISQYICTQVKSTKIISADDVWMIESNTGLKKQLWTQLQKMFGV